MYFHLSQIPIGQVKVMPKSQNSGCSFTSHFLCHPQELYHNEQEQHHIAVTDLITCFKYVSCKRSCFYSGNCHLGDTFNSNWIHLMSWQDPVVKHYWDCSPFLATTEIAQSIAVADWKLYTFSAKMTDIKVVNSPVWNHLSFSNQKVIFWFYACVHLAYLIINHAVEVVSDSHQKWHRIFT